MLYYRFLFLLIATTLTSVSYAGVSAVDYQIRYNTETCYFDVYLIIVDGSATEQLERTQAGSQISIVVPTGSAISIVETYAPFQGNIQAGTGTIPTVWYEGNAVIAPAVTPDRDYYTYKPFLSPTSRYNNLTAGDTVKILTLEISDPVLNISGPRLFNNQTDPSSSAAGMNGGNFSNGFTIGLPSQVYRQNEEQVYPSEYADISGQYTVHVGTQVSLTPTTGGSWTNQNTAVAVLIGTNVFTTAAGIGTFKYTPSSGCAQFVTLNIIEPSTSSPINTGLGNTNPDPTAIFDITSTTRGMRIPQMTKNQALDIPSPVEGQLVYVTNPSQAGVFCWINSGWYKISSTDQNSFSSTSGPLTSLSSSSNLADLLQQLEVLESQIELNQQKIKELKALSTR